LKGEKTTLINVQALCRRAAGPLSGKNIVHDLDQEKKRKIPAGNKTGKVKHQSVQERIIEMVLLC